MSYSIETYDKAQSILDRRKERATLEAQDRADELCAKIPELNTINRKLAQIGLNISKTFFTSQNPKEDIDRLRTESLALQEEKKNLLKRLSALGFAMYECRLYCDTHPNDTEALQMLNDYKIKYEAVKAEFEKQYGPLTLNGFNSDEWLKDPWPWDIVE